MGKLNIEIDDSLHTNLKVICVKKQISMKDTVINLIKDFIKKESKDFPDVQENS